MPWFIQTIEDTGSGVQFFQRYDTNNNHNDINKNIDHIQTCINTSANPNTGFWSAILECFVMTCSIKGSHWEKTSVLLFSPWLLQSPEYQYDC